MVDGSLGRKGGEETVFIKVKEPDLLISSSRNKKGPVWGELDRVDCPSVLIELMNEVEFLRAGVPDLDGLVVRSRDGKMGLDQRRESDRVDPV